MQKIFNTVAEHLFWLHSDTKIRPIYRDLLEVGLILLHGNNRKIRLITYF